MEQIAQSMADVRERISALEQDEKSVHRRLDNLECMVDSIHKLASSSVELAAELKAMRKDVNDIDKRVEKIESIPSRRCETVIKAFLTAFVGGIIGYIVKYIFK